MTTERKSLTLQYRLLKVCHVVLVVFFLGYLFAAGSLFLSCFIISKNEHYPIITFVG